MKIREFKKQCRQMGKLGEPDQTWLQQSRSFLLSQIKPEAKAETVSIWLKLADILVPSNFRLQPVAVYSLVLGLFLVTSFASINASKNTLPGQPLYVIKITAESIKYNLSFSDQAKAKVAMSLVKSRVDELKEIVAEAEKEKINKQTDKQIRVALAVEQIKINLDKVKSKLYNIKNETKDKDTVATAKEIDKKLALVKQEVKKTGKEIENKISKDLEEAHVVALAVLDESQKAVKADAGPAVDSEKTKDVSDGESTGVAEEKTGENILPTATSTPTSSADILEPASNLKPATSSDTKLNREDNKNTEMKNLLIIENDKEESKEFDVGIGE